MINRHLDAEEYQIPGRTPVRLVLEKVNEKTRGIVDIFTLQIVISGQG